MSVKAERLLGFLIFPNVETVSDKQTYIKRDGRLK